MTIRSIGIVGHGSFGKLIETLVRRFAPWVEIRIHSSRSEPDGTAFFTLAETAQCDALILAVPIRVFEETLVKILPLTRKDTIIVDVATVKVHTLAALKRHAKERRYLSSHPMFGPESYEKKAKDVSGFRIVVCEHTIPQDSYGALAEFARHVGFAIIEMSAEEHDRLLAETLFVTHFIGQSVDSAGFHRTPIDTISFGFLMDAVESVRTSAGLFADVYAFNPYCKDAFERWRSAQAGVTDRLEKTAAKNT